MYPTLNSVLHNHDIEFYNMLEMIKLKASDVPGVVFVNHVVAMAIEPINVVNRMQIYLKKSRLKNISKCNTCWLF
jgi:hypothetical protein